ncbi:MAG: DUF2339 domain-containing protein, partial [Planctomycetes bacterium]|nr:DUF2339 domain-containing protein [Planctomycetota bacterium]
MECMTSVLLVLSLMSFIIILVILTKISTTQKKVNELTKQFRELGKLVPREQPSSRGIPHGAKQPIRDVQPEPEHVETPFVSQEKALAEVTASTPTQPVEAEKKPEPAEDESPGGEVAVDGVQPTGVPEDSKPADDYLMRQEKAQSDAGIVKEAFEQQVGILWVLIAGIITTLVATGFFLRYAYENDLIPAWGRVMIIVVFGLLALGLGEWTRRRDYGVVARGLTAMGFAIMYGAVFSASSYYKLIGTTTALSLSIVVTVLAMLYAMGVNEILAAFIALVGGYLSPIIISTGENRPHALFGYVSVLSIGAMACAIFRKWRAVNILAFLGTFGLYIGWFEKFYRPATRFEATPEQFPVALGWFSVFFVIFL